MSGWNKFYLEIFCQNIYSLLPSAGAKIKCTIKLGAFILMFTYLTSYRCYTLAKAGFAAAYLWFVWDFFRIHEAAWGRMATLLSDPSQISFFGNPQLDIYLRSLAVMVSGKAMVYVFLIASPLAVTGFVWGRHRWFQFAIGAWISFSMIALNCLVGIFNSTADIWVNFVFVSYSLTALISSTSEWAEQEAGFNWTKWRQDSTLASRFAWLVVWLEFNVYLFAGINKLIYGWAPWVKGMALQNLAFDSSMHQFVRGMHVPYLISLVLCYITLFQRLVVPFGFFFRRFRFWSVLILGTMHIGYAILMSVNLFPVIGLASLLMILPPRQWETDSEPMAARKSDRRNKTKMKPGPLIWVPGAIIGLFSLWLLVESSRLTVAKPMPWENKLMLVPVWRMFADGGATAGDKWRLILETPKGEVDGSSIAAGMLPGIWRDRFYNDDILHEVMVNNVGPGSLPQKLVKATEQAYGKQQLLANGNPTVLNSGFDIYQRTP